MHFQEIATKYQDNKEESRRQRNIKGKKISKIRKELIKFSILARERIKIRKEKHIQYKEKDVDRLQSWRRYLAQSKEIQ